MERFLRKPKERIQGNLVRNVDTTYALHTEVAERALVAARVDYACISGHDLLAADENGDNPDARDDAGGTRQLLRKGLKITSNVRTAKYGLGRDDARAIVAGVCRDRGGRAGRAAAAPGAVQDLLHWVIVTVHHSAATPGCLLRSTASPAMLRRKQSSFATVRRRDLIPLLPPGDQGRAAHDVDAAPRGVVVVYCKAFLRLARGAGERAPEDDADVGQALTTGARSADWVGDYALVEVPPGQGRQLFVGTYTRTCRSVDASIRLTDLWVVSLQDIRQQLILLSERNNGNTLRFLDFYGDVDL